MHLRMTPAALTPDRRHTLQRRVRLIVAGLACLVHAVFPFLCVTTGSCRVRALYTEMTQRQAVAQSRPTEFANSQAH